MENKSISSIIFETASGHKVEVTQAQMDKVRKQLWTDEDRQYTQHTEAKQMPQVRFDNKENELNKDEMDYFDDRFDDDFYDQLLLDEPVQNINPMKRSLDENSVNCNYKKKKSF